MEIKIVDKSIFGKVLFKYSKEGNTIKDTIEEAIKRGANLCGANLRDADLGGANLCGADLGGANLCGADLCGADLCGANLCGADLGGANLRGANLCGANLRDADLCGANLHGADLYGTNLYGANLGDAGEITSVDDILLIGPIGSRSDYTHIYRTNNGIYVKCGCFFGTMDEFASNVEVTHGDNKYGIEYRKIIDFAYKYFEKNE